MDVESFIGNRISSHGKLVFISYGLLMTLNAETDIICPAKGIIESY